MKRLMRVWYPTDVDDDDPDYLGALSAPISEKVVDHIVAVDWSKRGDVEVTYVVETSS